MITLQITDSQKFATIIEQDDKSLYVSYDGSFYATDCNGFLIHISTLSNVSLHDSIKIPRNHVAWYAKNLKCEPLITALAVIKITKPEDLVSLSTLYFALSAKVTELAKSKPTKAAVVDILCDFISDGNDDIFKHHTAENSVKYCKSIAQLWETNKTLADMVKILGENFDPTFKISTLLTQREQHTEAMVKPSITLQNAIKNNAPEKILAMLEKPITRLQTAIDGLNKQLAELGYVDPVEVVDEPVISINPQEIADRLAGGVYDPENQTQAYLDNLVKFSQQYPTVEVEGIKLAIDYLQSSLGIVTEAETVKPITSRKPKN